MDYVVAFLIKRKLYDRLYNLFMYKIIPVDFVCYDLYMIILSDYDRYKTGKLITHMHKKGYHFDWSDPKISKIKSIDIIIRDCLDPRQMVQYLSSKN